MSYRLRAFLIAFTYSTVLGFLAGYWVVVRDPTGTGASIIAFPAIAAVTLVTTLLGAVAFGLWAMSQRVAPFVLLSSFLIPLFFLISPGLLRIFI